jgi:hypothetical protein
MRGFLWLLLTGFLGLIAGTAVIVLVVWPLGEQTAFLPNAELWDPASGRWTVAGEHDCRSRGLLTRTADGRVVLFDCGAEPLVWNERSRTFDPEPAISPPACGGRDLGDGRAISLEDGSYLEPARPGAWVFQVGSDRCEQTASRARFLQLDAAIALDADRIFIAGEESLENGMSRPALAAGIARGDEWTDLPPPPIAGASIRAAALVEADHVLVVAQDNAEPFAMHALLFDAAASSWQEVEAPPQTSSMGAGLVALGDGRALLVGVGEEGRATSLWSSGHWAPSAPLLARRDGASALAIGGGRVLVAGGEGEVRSIVPSENVIAHLVTGGVLLLLVALFAFLVWRFKPPAWAIVVGLVPGLLWAVSMSLILPNLTFGHGRPLRVRGRARRAGVKRGRWSWRGVESAVLHAAWTNDAALEEASVTAFDELARELSELGAEEALVAWAQRASAEEREHARLCSDMAGHYGAPIETIPLEAPPRSRRSRAERLVELARESLRDGCMGEGFAASAAAVAESTCDEAAARAALATIARDEASHAELAWAVLAFCLEEGGSTVRDAVCAELRALEHARPHRGFLSHGWTQDLRAHGRFVENVPGALDAKVRGAVIERARTMP